MKTFQNATIWCGYIACFAVTLLFSVAAQADETIYRQALRSTAWVLSKTDGGTSSGTGVLVDEERRLLVTNFHVVGDARAAVVFFPDFGKSGQPVNDRNHYLKNVRKLGIRGRVLGVDRKRDLALVELDRVPDGVKAIAMASSSAGAGADIQSIGNSGSSEALWVFTSGTVRSVYQKQFRTGSGEHDFLVLETQSPINPGDSGGPVVNNKGELVGIAQSISPKARLVSYNVDVTEVTSFLAGDWKPAPLPIGDVLKKAELAFEKHESGHLEVSFEQEDKSRQTVFIAKEIEYFERADVRRIWSLAVQLQEAPSAAVMMQLLQQNARTKLGGWTIERSRNGEYLVIYVSKLDATASPEAVKSVARYVARLTHLAAKELKPKTPQTESPAETLASWLSD